MLALPHRLGNRLEKRLHGIEVRLHHCNAAPTARERDNRARNGPIRHVEGHEVGKRHARHPRRPIDDDGADERYERGQRVGDLVPQRQVVFCGKADGFRIGPLSERAFLGTGQLQLRYAVQQSGRQTRHHQVCLNDFALPAHLRHLNDDAHDKLHHDDDQRRHDKRWRICRYLHDIDEREDGGETRS